MGAWSADAFGNDAALDLVDELLTSGAPEQVEQALKNALHPPETRPSWWQKALRLTPAPQCSETHLFETALAAAEIVALWHGRPQTSLPDGLAEWARKHRSFLTPDLRHLAQNVVHQAGAGSDLQKSWDAADPAASEWQTALANLQNRLA